MNDFNIDLLKSIDKFTLFKLMKNYENDRRLYLTNFLSQKSWLNCFHLYKLGYFKEEEKKYRRLVSKRGRIKVDISRIIEKNCIFLTLTFDNEHIDIMDKRQCICRWLRKLKCNYLGNVDYGEENGRIHYHVIVQTDFVDYASYKYGAINGKRIKVINADALKRYIVKLTNHACKKSADREERILKSFKYD